MPYEWGEARWGTDGDAKKYPGFGKDCGNDPLGLGDTKKYCCDKPN